MRMRRRRRELGMLLLLAEALKPVLAAPVPEVPAATPVPALLNTASAGAGWADCVAHQAPLTCANAREPAALALAGARAQREGAVLRLALFGAETPGLTLVDQPGPVAIRRYRLLGSLERAPEAWVVAEMDGASDTPEAPPPRLRLLGPGNPQGLLLADWPWLAPNGRQIVVVHSPESGHLNGSITLLQKAGIRWSQIFRYEPPTGLHFYFRSWRADSAALRLDWQRSGPGCPSGEAAQGTLQLRDGPYGWDFIPEPPSAC